MRPRCPSRYPHTGHGASAGLSRSVLGVTQHLGGLDLTLRLPVSSARLWDPNKTGRGLFRIVLKSKHKRAVQMFVFNEQRGVLKVSLDYT